MNMMQQMMQMQQPQPEVIFQRCLKQRLLDYPRDIFEDYVKTIFQFMIKRGNVLDFTPEGRQALILNAFQNFVDYRQANDKSAVDKLIKAFNESDYKNKKAQNLLEKEDHTLQDNINTQLNKIANLRQKIQQNGELVREFTDLKEKDVGKAMKVCADTVPQFIASSAQGGQSFYQSQLLARHRLLRATLDTKSCAEAADNDVELLQTGFKFARDLLANETRMKSFGQEIYVQARQVAESRIAAHASEIVQITLNEKKPVQQPIEAQIQRVQTFFDTMKTKMNDLLDKYQELERTVGEYEKEMAKVRSSADLFK